ncbi:hypothetical protein PMAYCL1PPCAC_19823, partial [Pristionchus mayeri]
LNSSFVLPSDLELRLAGFYYDEAEHKNRMNATFSDVVNSICASFPRYLMFDRFVLIIYYLISRNDCNRYFSEPLNNILSHHGFMHRNVSDISREEKSGFVIVKNSCNVALQKHKSLKNKSISQLMAAAKIFLQKPLRSSVFVDTLFACIESSTGTCEELASLKIEKCVK